VSKFLETLKLFLEKRNKADHTYFHELEKAMKQKLALIKKQSMYLEQFTLKLNALLEYKYVLLKTRELLG